MQSLLLVLLGLALFAPAQPVASAQSFAGKEKHKVKEKRFEPVPMIDARGYAGHYVGIEDQFWLDVTVGSGGAIEVALHQYGAAVPLEDVEIIGSTLRANQVDAAGDRRAFEATFGNMTVNGETSFGLRVEGDVRIDDDVVLNRLFCRRLGPPGKP